MSTPIETISISLLLPPLCLIFPTGFQNSVLVAKAKLQSGLWITDLVSFGRGKRGEAAIFVTSWDVTSVIMHGSVCYLYGNVELINLNVYSSALEPKSISLLLSSYLKSFLLENLVRLFVLLVLRSWLYLLYQNLMKHGRRFLVSNPLKNQRERKWSTWVW